MSKGKRALAQDFLDAVPLHGAEPAPAERAQVQAYCSTMFGVSAVTGPMLGAFIVCLL